MRKTILLFGIVALFGAANLSAQQRTTFGVKAEANMSNFILKDMPGYKSDFGVGAGITGFVKIDFGKYFALQPELMFNWHNSTLKQNGAAHDIEYWGMEIPVYAMGQLTTENGDRAYIGIGPYGRFGFSAKDKTANVNLYKKNGSDKPFMQRGDVGAKAIIGYEFAFGMQINVTYQYGLLNLLDDGSGDSFMRNQIIGLGIGYRF